MIHNAETLTFSIINHKKAAGTCVFDGSEFIVISVSGYTFFFLPDKGCPFSLQQFRQFSRLHMAGALTQRECQVVQWNDDFFLFGQE